MTYAPEKASNSDAVGTNTEIQSPETRVVASSKLIGSSSRYSEKFRAGIVRRIIEGSTSFKQVASEHSISRKEVWSWVVDQFTQNQEIIADLKRTLRRMEDEVEGRRTTASEFGSTSQPWTTVVVAPGFPDRLSVPPSAPSTQIDEIGRDQQLGDAT